MQSSADASLPGRLSRDDRFTPPGGAGAVTECLLRDARCVFLPQ